MVFVLPTAKDDFGVKERLAFIDILLLSQMRGSDLTDQNIQEEVDTFMFEVEDSSIIPEIIFKFISLL